MNLFYTKIPLKIVWLFLLVFNCGVVNAQTSYTPYDDLPSINKLEKPSFNAQFPDWAKKLYQFPVNYYEVCDEFDAYLSVHPNVKNAIIRYFINWKSVVEPFVLDNGEIEIPRSDKLFEHNRKVLLQFRNQQKSAATNNSNSTHLGV